MNVMSLMLPKVVVVLSFSATKSFFNNRPSTFKDVWVSKEDVLLIEDCTLSPSVMLKDEDWLLIRFTQENVIKHKNKQRKPNTFFIKIHPYKKLKFKHPIGDIVYGDKIKNKKKKVL